MVKSTRSVSLSFRQSGGCRISNRLFAGAGLTVVRETPYDDSGATEDLAGLVNVAWKVYKYTAPKVWVDANISFVPYLTDPGRYRVVINLNPKVSIFSNNLYTNVRIKIY